MQPRNIAPATVELSQAETAAIREKFLEGMSRAATTVTIVTTDGAAGRAGVTVSAMTSVSAEPDAAPTLLVCIHHLSPAAGAIRRNTVFCVNVLPVSRSDIADRFAGRVRGADKFDGAVWTTLQTGSPAASEALVSFDCELASALRQGSHWIFIGKVVDVAVGDKQSPLVYANRSYIALRDAS
jgi:flavin reductase